MKSSGYARVAHDWYVEDRETVNSLLRAEAFRGDILDPACGRGNIPEAFRAAGYAAVGSDIADRGYGLVNHDFLTTDQIASNIVSNPPYGIIEPFLYKAMEVVRTGGKIIFLARLAFLEGQARRDQLFRVAPPAHVWVCSRRPSMPPGGTDIVAKGGSIAYAWFVWVVGMKPTTTIGWLS